MSDETPDTTPEAPTRRRRQAPWRIYTPPPSEHPAEVFGGALVVLEEAGAFSRLSEAEAWVQEWGQHGVAHRLLRDPGIVLTPIEVRTRSLERAEAPVPEPVPEPEP